MDGTGKGAENRMSNAMESTRTAEMIAVEINVIKGQTRDVILRSAIEIGRRLYEAKAIVPYGRWGGWLKENVDYSERTAQNLMKCFDEYGQNPQALADVSSPQAVALLTPDGEQRAALTERVDVSELAKRQLHRHLARPAGEQAPPPRTVVRDNDGGRHGGDECRQAAPGARLRRAGG